MLTRRLLKAKVRGEHETECEAQEDNIFVAANGNNTSQLRAARSSSSSSSSSSNNGNSSNSTRQQQQQHHRHSSNSSNNNNNNSHNHRVNKTDISSSIFSSTISVVPRESDKKDVKV